VIRPRSLARRAALQYCFMCDLNSEWHTGLLRDFFAENCDPADASETTEATDSDKDSKKEEGGEAQEFARSLINQVLDGRDHIDALLQESADNWNLNRIAAVERNILRVACAELLSKEVPDAVAISEAVSLAKKFGSKDSSRFVNGILDRIARRLREGTHA
jgi:transcription antitermination protein NusB